MERSGAASVTCSQTKGSVGAGPFHTSGRSPWKEEDCTTHSATLLLANPFTDMTMFAQVGIPKKILTDQGTNFTSQLLSEVYRLLHIQPIWTSPYHPHTDGLVERFNQKLKAMLRRAASEEGKDWDKLIPYVLFAYTSLNWICSLRISVWKSCQRTLGHLEVEPRSTECRMVCVSGARKASKDGGTGTGEPWKGPSTAEEMV